MIVMLLRSIALHKGLCNVTRLIIRRLGRQVIEAEIVTETNIGGRALIPQIPLVPINSDLTFKLYTVKFTIRAAFVMTINKAQGQTMETVGLYLPRPCLAMVSCMWHYQECEVRRVFECLLVIVDLQMWKEWQGTLKTSYTRKCCSHLFGAK
ncbi:hypothetical protein O6H91_Y254000 [Diphasiastrum complanatum]|nr:hypothetical protein O6H91_Y254000 [Diphasiastrum complanatum]